MQRRKLIFAAAAAAASAPFLGASAAFAAEKTLRVGVTAGPSAQILEYVVPIAKELGLNVKIYEFQDYIQPNAALDAGDIDANIYCTKPFLDHENETRGYSLRIAAPAFTLPMAVYSKKIKSLKELPQDATVVSVVTGNGLKDVANAIKSAGEPINIKPDLDLMVEEFAKRGVTVE